MNEMNKNKSTFRGGPVRKTLLIAALAAILVLAFAGTVMAAGINHSGQLRLGAATTETASSPTSATIIGGGTNTYDNWNTGTGYGTNGTVAGDNSPHGNYATTTVKCVVCHAVHYAAPGGAPIAGGAFNNGLQTADTLLRVKASDACVFCHATTGQAVNGRPVYDGLGDAILAPGATGGNTTTGHITGTNCSYCHTNVHGAGADHTVASLDGYLLKLMTATDVQGTGATTTNMIEAITAIDNNAVNQGFQPGAALAGTIGTYATVSNSTLREQAVGVFCAECHNGAYATAAAGASTNVQNAAAFQGFSGHRIAASATTTWNVDGSKSSGLFSGTVAWAAAANCKSCHDANDTFGNKAFPHSWGGTKMWLTSAANAGAAASNLPYGTAPGSAYNVNRPQLSDGVCLKCHVASGGTDGVGITY
jgi:hypothetical protein